MSDDLSEWPYSYYGSNPTPQMRISDLLKDAGWDDDVRRVYGADDDDDEFDESDFGADFGFRDRCECKIVQLFSAADDLKDFLERDGSTFPKTDAQIDSFAALGGWAHGPWSMYLSVPSSVPADTDEGGSLHLFGCSKKGHSCRVLINRDGVVSIRAEKPELLRIEVVTNTNSEPAGEDEDSMRAREAREEELYDRRTYSELDNSDDDEDEDGEIDLIEMWRAFMAPEEELSAFINGGLEPEDVVQLSRFMPRSQVSYWVETFGHESMMALEYLKIGLGELTFKEELVDLDFERLRSQIAIAIRLAVFEEFEKSKDFHRVVEKKKPEDEFFDLDNDPYWDDDL
jgi:hypothetical protein